MTHPLPKRICLVPRVSGVGGMVSFQYKFAAGMAARGIAVSYDLADRPYDAVLVIGGTRQLAGLWRAKRRGIPIIQRLNGMNWLHRLRRTGLRHTVRAEYGNWLLAFIRRRLATGIVYQSEFTQGWWERVYGPTRVPSRVVYNGVDLEAYTPDGAHERPESPYRVLLVEGSLGGGYEMGLETAVQMAEALSGTHGLPVELMVAGKVTAELQAAWAARAKIPIRWAGLLPREQIPQIDRSAHLLYSADLNAACPNAAIEALACGLPVVAFDTGALAELVRGDAGRVVPYGGDPWQVEPPDVPALAKAAAEILQEQGKFRAGARERAEAVFGLEAMVDQYLGAIGDSLDGNQKVS
ncbi:MAG: glycosyltransferase family 4 protein [Anaerolineae bacterium]|nr:glycosyltransferase family 4 protein [Anaerolineae bacterium]